MIEATIYNRETGAIRLAGTFPDVANARANIGPGEGWIPGLWDNTRFYVRGEQAVPRLIPAIDTTRPQRDQLLADSDWTQLADAPLTKAKKAAWRAYRQALRDLPETGDWPEPPTD